MARYDTDRTARVMAAAISRRRALKGAAGAAVALQLVGRRRAHAATVDPGSARLLDLPRAVIRPSDLPDGERFFGLVGDITFLGPSGGEWSGVLDARRLDALGPARESLRGGHSATLVPLTGETDEWWTITHHQFTDTEQAQVANDGYRSVFFAGTEEVTPDEDPASYYWWTLPHQDGFVTTRAVLFQTQTVVTTILGMTRFETEPPAPAPAEVVNPLNELTKVSTGRLELVLNNSYAGLGATIPTWTEVAAAADGRLGPGLPWWQQGYLQVDGRPHRWIFQSDEQYALFQAEYPDVEEAIYRLEYVGDNPLFVRVDAYRIPDALRAVDFFAGIGERAAEATERDPTFVSEPLDPPEEGASDRPTQAYWQSFPTGAGTISGVQTWVQNGTDVGAVLFALPACPPAEPPEESDDPGADEPTGNGAVESQDVTVIETLQAVGSVAVKVWDPNDPNSPGAAERWRDQLVEDEAKCLLIGSYIFEPFCGPLLDEEGLRRIRDRAKPGA